MLADGMVQIQPTCRVWGRPTSMRNERIPHGICRAGAASLLPDASLRRSQDSC